jgi:hypothetical protein
VCCSPPLLACTHGTAKEQFELIKNAVNDVEGGVFLTSLSGIMDDKFFDTSFFEDDEDEQ